MSEKKTQAIDPDLVRELAAVLNESGLSEIEVEHGELRLRLARALDLLGRCEDLTTLSMDLGFSSHSHFSSAFRQAYGRTPAEFQRSVRLR